MTSTLSPHPSPPPPPPLHPDPRQRRTGLIVAVIVAACVIVAAAVIVPLAVLGNHGSSGSTSGGSSDALSTYRSAVAAAKASAGCHYVAVTSGAGGMQQIVGDAAQSSGKQVITLSSTFGSERFTLLLVNHVVYFQGNSPALEDQLGVSSGKAPGLTSTWISVRSGDGPYNVLSPGITVGDQATEIALEPSSVASLSEADGTAALRITGDVPPQNGAPAGTGHLDVSSAGHLPLVYVSTVSGSGATGTSTTTFSNWGHTVTVQAPGSSVAWSTLGAVPPPGGYGGGGSGGGGGQSTPTPFAV